MQSIGVERKTRRNRRAEKVREFKMAYREMELKKYGPKFILPCMLLKEYGRLYGG